MATEKELFSESHILLELLLEDNFHSEKGIAEVPSVFIDKHLHQIGQLNEKAKSKVFTSSTEISYLQEKQYVYNTYKKKVWNHKSVVKLMNESSNINPIDEIKNRARHLVLQALEDGWNGPPYNAIELARILKYDIMPNDTILDARTISPTKGKVLIEYNPFQKPTRMNFSIAHEIAHTLFSDFHEEIRNREEQPDKNRELEQLCNIGAAEIQLPYVIFPADANEIESITLNNLIELANKYKSSLESLLNAFVSAVDRICAIMFFTFQDNKQFTLDYYKTSSRFKMSIPNDFILPDNSLGYQCLAPGISKSETIKWDFFDEFYDVFYVGISPIRKDKRSRVGVIIVPNAGREHLQNRKISIDYGDATKPVGKGTKIIAQVVNTSGGLGAGFGKSLSKNYPQVVTCLKSWKQNKREFKLGESQLVNIKQDLYVFQMLAQNGLYPKNGKTPLEYTSLQNCLRELRETAVGLNAEVHMPLIGAGNAKGDWNIIEGMIYSELVNQDVKVHIYLWGTKKPDDFNPKASLSLFNDESTWQKEK